METLAMPFNETGADVQSSILSMITTLNVRVGQIETTTSGRLDRIDQRLDRIIEMQTQSTQRSSSQQPIFMLSGSQFAMAVTVGVVAVIMLWLMVYYGGNRG